MYPNFVKPQQDWRNGLAYMATDFEERLSERTWNWNKKLMIEAKAFPQPATESEVSNNACQSPGLPTFPPSPVSPQISTTEDDLPFVYSPNSSFSSTFSSSVESESPPSSPVSPTAEVLFTTEIFEVRKSPKGGWGAFALVDIEKDTVVLSEAPLFRSGALQIYAEYEKLTSQQRKEYLTLACWYGVENYKVQAIFNTNRFMLSDSKDGIFMKSSRFNHACRGAASCTYAWHSERGQLVTTACTGIMKGQEITVPYAPSPSGLYQKYGFYCDCICCPPPEEAKRMDEFCRGPE